MRLRALLAASAVALVGVITPIADAPSASAQTASNSGMVRTWNAYALAALGNPANAGGAAQPPNVAVLHMAMVQGAVYDAVNSIDGGHEPFVDGVPAAPPTASLDAAVATAAFRVLDGLGRPPVPPLPPAVLAALKVKYDDTLASIEDSPEHTAQGVTAGEAAAKAMLTARDGDGRYVPFPLTEGSDPGEWRTALPSFVSDPNSWISEVTPFTLLSTSQFRTPGPRNLNSAAYAHEYDEVKTLGAALPKSGISPRTPQQDAIAAFFNVSPVELLNRTYRTISEDESLSLVEDARLFAMLNVAGADTIINCWNDKRFHSFWRPITAIREGANDGNKRTVGDPNWLPLEPTPPYADHTSGYNCVSGSFMNAGKAFFGSDQMEFTIAKTTSDTSLKRDYHRLTDVIDDTIEARVLQGIHFRSADVQGARMGRQVAEWVAANAFRPVG